MSAQNGKDIIYIDIDDEITTIIDKVRGSGEKIVALVLPKRATVFQSIVNMKLLKRTADSAKKHLVLITAEAGLLPLAASVGLHVAKTLQSKPEIPHNPMAGHAPDDSEEEAVSMADNTEALDPSKPVGAYASTVTPSAVQPSDDDDQPIELDNDASTRSGKAAKAAGVAGLTGAGAKAAKSSGGKKFKVPNFDKFRLWMVIGAGGLLLLIFIWYMAADVMPRATVIIKTDSTALQSSTDVTFKTTADEVDTDANIVPAVAQQTQKTATQQVEATGQKDNGTKATGSITMTAGACTATAPNDVPAGSGVSGNGLTFITQNATTFVPQFHGRNCVWGAAGATNVVAQNNGDSYNIGPATFSIAGRSDLSASSSKPMAGGSSQIVKVIAQADIDNAKQKITSQDTAAIKQELTSALQSQGLFVVGESFYTAEPEITTSAHVGDQADSVTVNAKTTYALMGTKPGNLQKLIDIALKGKIDTSKQKIIDYGLDTAQFKPENQQPDTMLLSMDDTAIAGTALNTDDLKAQIAGKKSGDAKSIIGKNPGVTNVDVSYSPFWVNSIPHKPGKITITVEKPAIKK